MKFDIEPITDLEGYSFALDVTLSDGWMARVPFNSDQDMPEIFRGLAAALDRHFAPTPAKDAPIITGGRIVSVNHDALLDILSVKPGSTLKQGHTPGAPVYRIEG